MNDQFKYTLTKGERLATLWQAVESQIMFAQDKWFDGKAREEFDFNNYVLVEPKRKAEMKEEVAKCVRTALKTQLWDKFNEDECAAFTDLIKEYVFVGNATFHIYFMMFMNPHHLSFDGFCMFMREWVAVNAPELCNMSVQERNQKISKKVEQINNYLIGNPFSDKLVSAMQISLTNGFQAHAAMEMHQSQKTQAVKEEDVVWRVISKEKFVDHTNILKNTLAFYQYAVMSDNGSDKDFMQVFHEYCEHQQIEDINDGSFRSLITLYMVNNLGMYLNSETLGKFTGDVFYIPNGMLGILFEHVTHSYILLKNQEEDGVSFSIGRMSLNAIHSQEGSMVDYIKGYATAIKLMYNELPSYRNEILTEIIQSHLKAIEYCYEDDGGFSKFNLDDLIAQALDQI